MFRLLAAFNTGPAAAQLFYPYGDGNVLSMQYKREDGQDTTEEMGKLVTEDLIPPTVSLRNRQ